MAASGDPIRRCVCVLRVFVRLGACFVHICIAHFLCMRDGVMILDVHVHVCMRDAGEVIRLAAGHVLEIMLDGDPAILRRSAAAVLLVDGALVAYGGGWEEEVTLQLPYPGHGFHTLTLGVVSDSITPVSPSPNPSKRTHLGSPSGSVRHSLILLPSNT